MVFIEDINHDERDRQWIQKLRGMVGDKFFSLSGKTQAELAIDSEQLGNRLRQEDYPIYRK